MMHEFFLTAARGTEVWVHQEALSHGASSATTVPGGVHVRGTLATGYRLCLWSRVAQRVLLPLGSFRAPDADALYEGVYRIDWKEHLTPETCFEVECTTAARASVRHTQFAALKAKDAIADYFRTHFGRRPFVARSGRRVTVHLYITGDAASVSIDLSGEPLYKRGYRSRQPKTPLKETLAAALLYSADWPARAAAGERLVDPFCGSGTLVIEAALMALGKAPGLTRTHFGFLAWKGHDASTWQSLVAEAKQHASIPAVPVPVIYGSDSSASALALARQGATRAGVASVVRLTQADARTTAPPERPGIVVTNPPYGARVGSEDLEELYASFGDVLRRRFLGWTAFVFTGNPRAAKHIGLRPDQRLVFWNGPIECRLLRLPIAASPVRGTGPSWRRGK